MQRGLASNLEPSLNWNQKVNQEEEKGMGWGITRKAMFKSFWNMTSGVIAKRAQLGWGPSLWLSLKSPDHHHPSLAALPRAIRA
jgi:hypothetical protein